MISDVSTRIRVFVPLALVAAILAAACSNQSDPRWLAAGESLVPPESEVIDVVENTTGLSFESGPYFVSYEITDGGLGVRVADAIVERARAAGWDLNKRTDERDAIELRFSRADLRAIVRVWLDRDPISASITVHGAE